MESVTVVTVNFKTPDLVRDCVETFNSHYPHLPYILIDNGGCAESKQRAQELAKRFLNIQLILNEGNIGHGPALNQGFELAETRYVFTLDSDTRVEKSGFLEGMLQEFESDPKLFTLGWLRYVADSGVPFPHQELKHGHPYVHPFAALFDRETFFKLQPFVHHGAPATWLMIDAIKKGYHLKSFPIEDYIWHKVAGTRGRFRGQVRIPTNREPEPWRYHRI